MKVKPKYCTSLSPMYNYSWSKYRIPGHPPMLVAARFENGKYLQEKCISMQISDRVFYNLVKIK